MTRVAWLIEVKKSDILICSTLDCQCPRTPPIFRNFSKFTDTGSEVASATFFDIEFSGARNGYVLICLTLSVCIFTSHFVCPVHCLPKKEETKWELTHF